LMYCSKCLMACFMLFASWFEDYTPLCQMGQNACNTVRSSYPMVKMAYL